MKTKEERERGESGGEERENDGEVRERTFSDGADGSSTLCDFDF